MHGQVRGRTLLERTLYLNTHTYSSPRLLALLLTATVYVQRSASVCALKLQVYEPLSS